jgi:hypothetical protein
MVSGICRVVVPALALAASACTITLGTGTGAQQPQPVYWVDNSGGGTSTTQPQPAPIPVGAVSPSTGPVTQPPTPVYTPATPPRHVGGGGWFTGHGGLPVLPRGSPFGGDGSTFQGTLYFVPVGAPRMPDFSTLQPQATTYTDHFNIPLTNSGGSLPPWPDRVEGFGLEYKGSFTVAAPGTYDFALYCDDGAIVYVDGKMVVNNDGIHDPSRADGKVDLTAGSHTVRLDYYLGYRWTVQLQLFVFKPNGDQELFGPQI